MFARKLACRKVLIEFQKILEEETFVLKIQTAVKQKLWVWKIV